MYQTSGSTLLTSRENGALHEMVMELLLPSALKSLTEDSKPVTCYYNHDCIASSCGKEAKKYVYHDIDITLFM